MAASIASAAPSCVSSSVRAISSCLRSRILSRRKASMARRLATAISQAPGLSGTPVLGHSDEGDDQRVLRQLLGTVDIPHHAGQARDEPGPFNAKGRFDCLAFPLMRLACGHTALSAKAAGETSPAAPTVTISRAKAGQATPSFPRSPSRGAASSSGVMNSARSAAS